MLISHRTTRPGSFEEEGQLQRFFYVQNLIRIAPLPGTSVSERQALLIDRFSPFLEHGRLPKEEIARRFKIKYRRFCRLVREFDAVVERYTEHYRTMNYVFRNAPSTHLIDETHLLFFLHTTGEAYVFNKKSKAFKRVKPSAALREWFPFLPWPNR